MRAQRRSEPDGRVSRPQTVEGLDRGSLRRIDPDEQIDPVVVAAMEEIGLDISAEFPKPLTDAVIRAADVVVTLGCGDACPVYPGQALPGLAGRRSRRQPIEVVRRIRYELYHRVWELIETLVPIANLLDMNHPKGASIEPRRGDTDIHGNLPALEASLAAIDTIGVDAQLLRRRPGRLWPPPQPGVPADRGSGDPDDLRQLRLRDRPRAGRLRVRVRDSARPRARPAVGRVDARAYRPGLQGLHAPASVRSALRARRARCIWSTARPARSTSICSRTSRPACTNASPPPRPLARSCLATPTSRGSTPTGACCSSTVARSANPRTATLARGSRFSSSMRRRDPRVARARPLRRQGGRR